VVSGSILEASEILGDDIGSAQFSESGSSIFRRTALGGKDNLNALIGWQGDALRKKAGLAAELEFSTGSEDVKARRLIIQQDGYARGAGSAVSTSAHTMNASLRSLVPSTPVPSSPTRANGGLHHHHHHHHLAGEAVGGFAKNSDHSNDEDKVMLDALDTPAWWWQFSVSPDDESKLFAAEMVDATSRAREILGQWVGTRRVGVGDGYTLNGVALWQAEKRAKSSPAAVASAIANYEATLRGFGGGKISAGSESEYEARLRLLTSTSRARLTAAEMRHKVLSLQLEGLMASLEVAAGRDSVWEPPLVVKKCREASAAATDLPLRRNWEEARLARAEARKAAAERKALEERRRQGITEEDERLMAIEEERAAAEKAQARVARGLPATDPLDLEEKILKEQREWEEYMRLYPGEEFQSGGFQAVVGSDGSLLEWAGDGTMFKLPLWKARYRVRPWVADLLFTRYLAGKTGHVFKTPADMYKIMDEMGASETMRAFKVASRGLPPQGMEATKLAVEHNRLEMKRLEEEKMAAVIKEEQTVLRKNLGDRKERSITAIRKAEDTRRERAKKKKEEAAALAKEEADKMAAEMEGALATSQKSPLEALGEVVKQLNPAHLVEGMKTMLAAAKEMYYTYRKDVAEQTLRGNKSLQVVVKKVKDRIVSARGTLAGISDFHFNYGVFDEAEWAQLQLKNYEEGKPYYVRLPGRHLELDPESRAGNMGTKDKPVFLWYSPTDDESEMISDCIWAPFDPNVDPIVEVLMEKGYQYATHPVLFPGWGLWFVRATGPPITAMCMSFNNEVAKELIRARKFKRVEGNPRSASVHPECTLFIRAEKVRRKIYKSISENLRSFECDALQRQVRELEIRVEEAQETAVRKRISLETMVLPGGVEYKTLLDGLARTKEILAKATRVKHAEVESHMAEKAIEFLGLNDVDTSDLSKSFLAMDPVYAKARATAMRKGQTNYPPLLVSMEQFYAYMDIVRTPMTDSIFYFMDEEVRSLALIAPPPPTRSWGCCAPFLSPLYTHTHTHTHSQFTVKLTVLCAPPSV